MRPAPLLLLLAVLGALAPEAATAQRKRARPAMQKQIDRAIERGVAYLLEEARGPRRQGGGLTASVAPLAAYALLQSGADRGDAALRGTMARVVRHEPSRTYEIACKIMALGAYDANENAKGIQRLADRIVRDQRNGTWGYPAGDDLSNTQYALLGLWAAHRAGARVPDRVWRRTAEAIELYGEADGGFSYHRGGRGPTGSMTAAGVGSLALCRSMLERAGVDPPLSDDLAHEWSVLEAQGLEWLADRFTVRENPGAGAGWTAYYLYGVERVGALCDRRRIGGHDWYSEGALQFLSTQRADGSWTGGGGTIATTAFALLFLGRATTKVARPPVSGPAAAAAAASGVDELHARDLGRNRAQRARPSVDASSAAKGHGPALACDGRHSTWWEARPSDPAPALLVRFADPHAVDTILVSHPRTPDPGVTLATEVQVRVNGGETYRLPMPDDRHRKGRLALHEPLSIDSIEVLVAAPSPAGSEGRRIGLGEIEIQTRPTAGRRDR
ncbi:MAG: hypothetical protein AAGB93_07105 [Planctomycetota bacterium]